jgi:HEPN domain-containing protein/predicted nucleotidyltransferase
MVILFGSYARGDWKDGPHEQGRGKLTIHKKSDYDILVVTLSETTARDVSLWQDIKQKCERDGLSTYLRIIPRDIEFINDKLREGQYFFTEIIEQGKMLYDSGNQKLDSRKPLNPEQEKRLAQHYLDEVFGTAKEFYKHYEFAFNEGSPKIAAFQLNQACEHAYKAVLLIFGGECPQEHHLDIIGDLAIHYCPDLAGLLPRETEEEEELFELLDYAYIGARYDYRYKISREQLDQLSPAVKKLHEVIERACQEKIDSLD